jgi:hypothetical protein
MLYFVFGMLTFIHMSWYSVGCSFAFVLPNSIIGLLSGLGNQENESISASPACLKGFEYCGFKQAYMVMDLCGLKACMYGKA